MRKVSHSKSRKEVSRQCTFPGLGPKYPCSRAVTPRRPPTHRASPHRSVTFQWLQLPPHDPATKRQINNIIHNFPLSLELF